MNKLNNLRDVMKLPIALFAMTSAIGCAVLPRSFAQGGSAARIAVIYYAPAWGPNEKGEEVVYFLKQVTLETATDEQNRIYFCSTKPDGSERKEIAQLWKDHPDQFFENYATAVTMDVNAATKRAAIGVEQGQRGGIFVLNLDGTGFRSLWPKEWKEDRPTTAGYPTWSPDGQWIAFQEYRFEKGFHLYRIVKCHPDASAYTPLTERQASNLQPAWSPAGDLIAFVNTWCCEYHSQRHLWLMNADGSEKRDTKQWGDYPRWSPDGKHVLHHSARVIDPMSGKEVRHFIPALPLFPKWGASGFVFCDPAWIGFTEPSGEGSRPLLKNVSRPGHARDIDKEEFRW